MSEWKEYKLGEITKYINRGISPEYVENNGFSIINQKCIRNGRIDLSHIRYTAKEKFYSKEKSLQNNDILINSTGVGTAGRVALFVNNNIFYVDSHVTIVRIDKNVANSRFIFYNLFRREEEIESIAEGSTGQIELGRELIKGIEILLPDLSIQTAIASILSSLDDKIDLLHRQNKILEQMAKTLFRQWFVEEADERWQEKCLYELLEFVVDNRGMTAPTVDSGIPLIATNCIKNKNIFPIYEKVRYVSNDTYDNWFRAHPIPGDIIFVNKGTPGCVNLVPDPIDFCIAQDMIALRIDKRIMSNYYLFLLFRTDDMQSNIVNSSVGTTIPHLKKTDLMKFKILCPEKLYLDKFDEIVQPFFKKMNANNQQIYSITKLRDTLLPKLMSGEVRVKN